jgi:hypothetical protein
MMICITVLPVMERVPKGRETREERLFFPVGTDRPARAHRRPAVLDLPVSPVPGIGPAGLEPSVPRPVYTLYTARAVYQPRAPQLVSLSQLRSAEPGCVTVPADSFNIPTAATASTALSPSLLTARRSDCLFGLCRNPYCSLQRFVVISNVIARPAGTRRSRPPGTGWSSAAGRRRASRSVPIPERTWLASDDHPGPSRRETVTVNECV